MTWRRPKNMFADWEVETEAKKKREWKMDSELSSATLTIIPVEREDGTVIYLMSDAVEIRPYPNPLSFGGSWGSSRAYSLEEAKEKEKLFLEKLTTWGVMDYSFLKDQGMTNIKVIWEEKETQLERMNNRRAEREVDQPLLLI